jgi:hypothetical protein
LNRVGDIPTVIGTTPSSTFVAPLSIPVIRA